MTNDLCKPLIAELENTCEPDVREALDWVLQQDSKHHHRLLLDLHELVLGGEPDELEMAKAQARNAELTEGLNLPPHVSHCLEALGIDQ